jgi:hypothetical protein
MPCQPSSALLWTPMLWLNCRRLHVHDREQLNTLALTNVLARGMCIVLIETHTWFGLFVLQCQGSEQVHRHGGQHQQGAAQQAGRSH